MSCPWASGDPARPDVDSKGTLSGEAEAQICQNICVVPKIMETRVDFAELCEKGEEYWSCPEPDCHWLKRKFAKLFQTDNQPAKLKYVHKNIACVTLVSEEEQEADLEKLREQQREKKRKEILGRLNKVKNAQEKALELKTRGAGAIVAWSCSNQDCQRLNRRNWQTLVEDGHTRYSNKYSHERQYCVEKYSVEQHRSDIVAAGGTPEEAEFVETNKTPPALVYDP